MMLKIRKLGGFLINKRVLKAGGQISGIRGGPDARLHIHQPGCQGTPEICSPGQLWLTEWEGGGVNIT